ncbi:hypothetical protein C8034_v006841 [Colletotrichum sidae]|uniref:Uncharacterized protein n=1 Tax=Colletotrichum sidae TaxID=1347389 RepID=A0A4R8T670_9PEZI|nr:hypothetical protein C8034_v006841 [Colletotrichum sidae]
MKFQALLAAFLVTLAGLVSTVLADAACIRSANGGSVFWEIKIDRVPDVGKVCHYLWQGLRRHIACVVTQPNGCDSPFDGDELYMYFTTSLVCNTGMVESAFWHATSNDYGPVDC